MYSCRSQLRKHKQSIRIDNMISWHSSTFDYKLRTIEAEILQKLTILIVSSTRNLLDLIKSVAEKMLKKLTSNILFNF